MTKEAAQFIVNALDYAGEEAELYEGYSGRAMYGTETWGVVFDSEGILFSSVMNFLKENPEKAKELPDFDPIRADNMGRQIIWY